MLNLAELVTYAIFIHCDLYWRQQVYIPDHDCIITYSHDLVFILLLCNLMDDLLTLAVICLKNLPLKLETYAMSYCILFTLYTLYYLIIIILPEPLTIGGFRLLEFNMYVGTPHLLINSPLT